MDDPTQGVVKINTDGASSGNPGEAGIGGLLRNSDGMWMVGFVQRIGFATALVAELWAMEQGLKLAWERGFRSVLGSPLQHDFLEFKSAFAMKYADFTVKFP